ncbi:MAG: Hpt domain-containing protein [Clostridia bacterium]|nr:Hpt domain-containing protein [Clostridia bacterium]
MTLENFYEIIGGDYAGTKSRFLTDERIARFTAKFPADESFSNLEKAIAENNVEEAFRAAHTLKGVAGNLGFTALFEISQTVTEILRGGSLDISAHMPELKRLYTLTVENIAKL